MGIKVKFPWLIKITVVVLKPLTALLSKELKQELVTWVTKFRAKAYETENPWDDFLADLLYEFFVK